MRVPSMPSQARAHFHLLAKPTGAICNLDCKYCFFLSKEMLYPGSRFRMADELLETYIRQLLESQPGPEVIVGWQGGEPTLMGLDFFERSVEYVERYKRPGQQRRLHDPDQRHAARRRVVRVLQGAQVPGRPERGRPARAARRLSRRQGRQGHFDDVMRGWQCLNRHGVDVNILCTVHAANADHPLEVYRFFRDELKTRVHPVHPDHRARDRRRCCRSPTSAGASAAAIRGRCTCSKAIWSRTARSAPSSGAGS